ncbi:MAG: hypothetical protein EBZ48_18115, partial [Proteobacteria bacterium]|nr:hypothetical protein [Pseudomonadota bacterium]
CWLMVFVVIGVYVVGADEWRGFGCDDGATLNPISESWARELVSLGCAEWDKDSPLQVFFANGESVEADTAVIVKMQDVATGSWHHMRFSVTPALNKKWLIARSGLYQLGLFEPCGDFSQKGETRETVEQFNRGRFETTRQKRIKSLLARCDALGGAGGTQDQLQVGRGGEGAISPHREGLEELRVHLNRIRATTMSAQINEGQSHMEWDARLEKGRVVAEAELEMARGVVERRRRRDLSDFPELSQVLDEEVLLSPEHRASIVEELIDRLAANETDRNPVFKLEPIPDRIKPKIQAILRDAGQLMDRGSGDTSQHRIELLFSAIAGAGEIQIYPGYTLA